MMLSKEIRHAVWKVSFMLACGILLIGCTDLQQTLKLETGAAVELTSSTVNLEGNIIDLGEMTVEQHGHCWSTTPDPTIDNNLKNLGEATSVGSFTSEVSELDANTPYYYKAFAVSGGQSYYGDEKQFTTRSSETNGGNPPVAAFTASQISIYENENVSFTDQSTNNPSSWSWNFGDGGTSTQQHPDHTYTTQGIYTVSLTVTNSNGSDTETKSDYISVTSETVGPVTDVDGNVYETVQIGDQWWFAENLSVTKLRDNTPIDLITSNSSWINLTTPAYCWYGNEAGNKETYGALYNGYAVMTDQLCPSGWHVATDEDWIELEIFLGMEESELYKRVFRGTDEANKLKETGTTHWADDTGSTDEVGFTALPGGVRFFESGGYNYMTHGGFFWADTQIAGTDSTALRVLVDWSTQIDRNFVDPKYGYSVRCVKD